MYVELNIEILASELYRKNIHCILQYLCNYAYFPILLCIALFHEDMYVLVYPKVVMAQFILSYVGSECLLKKDLSTKCQEICHEALGRFQYICTQIQSGELTMCSLHKLSTNRDTVARLCKAAALNSASEWLEQRVHESQLFLKCRGTYREICNRISEPSKVKGLLFIKSYTIIISLKCILC